jgi:hypothetical protein
LISRRRGFFPGVFFVPGPKGVSAKTQADQATKGSPLAGADEARASSLAYKAN